MATIALVSTVWTLALVLACLAYAKHRCRVKPSSDQLLDDSQKDVARFPGLQGHTTPSSHPLAFLEQSQSSALAEAPSLWAFAPPSLRPATWRSPSLPLRPQAGRGSKFVVSDVNGNRAKLHSQGMHMVSSPIFPPAPKPGDIDFEAALSNLAPFAELEELRKMVRELNRKILDADTAGDGVEEDRLRKEITELRSKDPSLLSSRLRVSMLSAKENDRPAEAAVFEQQLRRLNEMQPEYQLAGVWKGEIPEAGDIFVRILYEGDELIAFDDRTLQDVVTFQADVSAPEEILASQPMPGQVAFKGEATVARGRLVAGQMLVKNHDEIGFLWLGKEGLAGRGSAEDYVAFRRDRAESDEMWFG